MTSLTLSQLTRTRIKDVMIPFADVYAVHADLVLNRKTVTEIVRTGYSRIPVYEDNKGDVIGILFIRDLVNVALDWTPDAPPVLARSGRYLRS